MTETAEPEVAVGKPIVSAIGRWAARTSELLRVGLATDRTGRRTVILAAALAIATMTLVWLGYVATREWRRGTEQVRERRAAEAAALSVAALTRDMKGAWASLIVPIDQFTIEEEPPYDLLQQTAQTFATFPYPESFIVLKDDSNGPHTFVFNRADRQPPWDQSPPSDDPYPIVLLRDPPRLQAITDTVRRLGTSSGPFVVFEQSVGGVPYQVIAHLMFSSSPPHSLAGLAALTINLDWVRKSYFGPLLSQVARIGGTQDLLSLAVTDESGTLLATSGAWPDDAHHDLQRHFPLLFADPVSLYATHSRSVVIREWAVHVRPGRDTAVDATLNAAYLTLALMAVAAAAITVALIQTVSAVRASARLASMKSDFVSAVTHELKTPLALIRLVAETLGRRRYASPDVIDDYAGILSKETARLGQSIDNLLTYARYTEAEHSARLLPRDVADLVEDAVDRFRPTMAELGFELSVNVTRDLPRIAVDGVAITKVIEILTDNAIKYSNDTRSLTISAWADRRHVTLTFADRGIGIHKDDIDHIFDRFFRGRNARGSGSGLGLAIAQRILTYHGGVIDVRSSIESGTEFDLRLPIANES